MNPARVTAEEYIQFLIGSPKVVSATEAARVQPDRPGAPAHDAYTRLLHRLEPDPEVLWDDVRPLLDPTTGVLVLDDSTLDKPRARHLGRVARHWSGNHHAVVRGINLLTALWSDGDRLYPCDYRIYHKAGDGKTKNGHFADLVRGFGSTFVTRLKANRKVRIDHGEARALRAPPIAASGTVVWLPGFGPVRVFRVVAPDGDTTHWATNDLGMGEVTRVMFAELSWSIEEYHRGLKQYTGVDRCHVRYTRGQRNHLGCAIRAFVRLEYHRFTTGISWFAAKWGIIRAAVQAYLAQPLYLLPNRATA
ncbi:MAG: Transposase domain protein [Gemmataceae bacterium]|nr:Transposase domain protein [Gemmataceae bacterium]